MIELSAYTVETLSVRVKFFFFLPNSNLASLVGGIKVLGITESRVSVRHTFRFANLRLSGIQRRFFKSLCSSSFASEFFKHAPSLYYVLEHGLFPVKTRIDLFA